MMNAEAVRQRIKYIIEQGETYPSEQPLSKPLAVKLTLVVIALQVIEMTVHFFLRH